MKAILFGEILFDRFEDGDRLGGAPLNCAWHIRQLGIDAGLVSAVGDDEAGQTALSALEAADIDHRHVRVRPEATGLVDIELKDGEPDYTIREGVAWDHIEKTDGVAVGDLLYFGTLSQRTEVNRQTLSNLQRLPFTHRFYDVNFRQHYLTPEIVTTSLTRATTVKLNEDEWEQISSMFDLKEKGELLEQFSLEGVVITLGDRGAEYYSSNTQMSTSSDPVEVVDAVGAGDAFSAVICAALIKRIPVEGVLKLACRVGAYVVQQRGAQVDLPEDLCSAI
jgi:fructokinase